MATINRFEDIEGWKKGRELSKRLYEISRIGAFAKDFGLKDQIRRAGVSVMSNIAEGFEREGNREFRQFLAVAKGSAGEVRSLLYVALDACYINQEQFEEFAKLAIETSRLVSGLMHYLDQSDLKGSKFKTQQS